MKKVHLFLLVNVSLCALFFLLLILDISPFLRGPADWPPQWRWGYYYVNTWRKIWAPSLSFLALIAYFIYLEKQSKLTSKALFIIPLIILGLIFHLSVIYFSRAGLFVLLSRIIKPAANGYLTASLKIDSWSSFMQSYKKIVLSLPQHARGHPPGAILPFWLANQLFAVLPFLWFSPFFCYFISCF